MGDFQKARMLTFSLKKGVNKPTFFHLIFSGKWIANVHSRYPYKPVLMGSTNMDCSKI